VADPRRELRRPVRCRVGRSRVVDPGGCRYQVRIVPQDRGVQALQAGRRIHAQLVGQPGAQPLVRLERVERPAGPVQREHRQLDEPFPQRVADQ